MAEITAKSGKSFMKSGALQKVLALGVLVVMFLVFAMSSPYFATQANIINILLATAVNGVLAIGVTFIIITGGIDLSIGTGMTFTSIMTGVAITFMGMPIWIGILVGLATGAFIGLINGICIAKLKIPAFIATLGMMMITKGLSLVVSGAKPIYFVDTKGFSDIATGTVLKIMEKNAPGVMESMSGTFFGGILSIPFAALLFLLAGVSAHIILNKTLMGRYNFAIGSNMQATRLSGINTDRWLMMIHVVAGLYVGLAGIIIAARLNSAQPALGQGYELDAIAACVIGGTSLSGGKGTIVGTVIGAFLLSTLLNGLRILSVPQEWQTVLSGLIVIGAVYADIYRRTKQEKAI